MFVLKKDSTFVFIEGNCGEDFKQQGTWRREKDTLYLDYQYPILTIYSDSEPYKIDTTSSKKRLTIEIAPEHIPLIPKIATLHIGRKSIPLKKIIKRRKKTIRLPKKVRSYYFVVDTLNPIVAERYKIIESKGFHFRVRIEETSLDRQAANKFLIVNDSTLVDMRYIDFYYECKQKIRDNGNCVDIHNPTPKCMDFMREHPGCYYIQYRRYSVRSCRY